MTIPRKNITRAYYSNSLQGFLNDTDAHVLGMLAKNSEFSLQDTQRDAWLYQINLLRSALPPLAEIHGGAELHFEFAIPRMGRRIDVVALIGGVVFVLEFKVGERGFPGYAIDQVVDYALDLKNFHEASHQAVIAPILIATSAKSQEFSRVEESKNDRVLKPLYANGDSLGAVMHAVLSTVGPSGHDLTAWCQARYCPTPTIVEAATALYSGHHVEDISRSDAGAINLAQTSTCIEHIIEQSRRQRNKSICFVTGVPGAGKTLVGLNIAARHIDPASDLFSVFLSGNGPLVKILHEALARDRVAQGIDNGERVRLGVARSEVKAFIQNVHHFRDDCLKDTGQPPVEHVALFDEAQRAWDLKQTANFMERKKGHVGFSQSEPDFLISCMDRHPDWAVVVCLVGGGQEINTGEAGIKGWLEAMRDCYPQWKIYASPQLSGNEYQADVLLKQFHSLGRVDYKPELHLSASMRSFRAENVSAWVKAVLDGHVDEARRLYGQISDRYPIVLSRSVEEGKAWTRAQARGSERYGLIVSSQAQRLKPYAIDVKSPIDPVHWFLDGKDDVRSSYYLEDVATEFHVQGLELDWVCLAWDADFRRATNSWQHFSFRGSKWQRINQQAAQQYQINAYRVLLTRARQGMAIVIPHGDDSDPTRDPSWYQQTYRYLKDVGVKEI